MASKTDKKLFPINDLILNIKPDVNRKVWNEDDYEDFLTLICEGRNYQRDAISTALRYLLAGEYSSLSHLSKENWELNPRLKDYYNTLDAFQSELTFPDKLSATLDLATGTGKSYVIYAIATILLAEGVVDKVLVLCPSTTIEKELHEKFKSLSANAQLINAIPNNKVCKTPKVIKADQTIEAGCICVENREAVYSHVRSSIHDSFNGDSSRVAVLNDETHHVANESSQKVKKWKEFIDTPELNFKYVLGFSGTCYVGDKYLSDVIYRYSLKQAIEDNFVKKIRYLAEQEKTGEENETWQLRYNMHERIKSGLVSKSVLPMSIIITKDIKACKSVAEDLIDFISEKEKVSKDSVSERVLVIYNSSPDVSKMVDLDSPDNRVEWIVSVSMLTEGWDVKRVFQIIPHEERAFNSKLLVSQVLGRGLRVPDNWTGTPPEVTVFNHSSWAHKIQSTVDEILENEKVITSKILSESDLHFDLYNLDYNVIDNVEVREKTGEFELFSKGFVDLPMEAEEVNVDLRFESVTDHRSNSWHTEIKRKTYTPQFIARQMHEILIKYDEESKSLTPESPTSYSSKYNYHFILKVVEKSLHGLNYCTESNRQKFLQSLGTLKRKETRIARYELQANNIIRLNTVQKSNERASASQLRKDKVAFIPSNSADTIDDEQKDFFYQLVEPGGDYKCVSITNPYDFKTPVNLMFTDSSNERRFVLELIKPDNNNHILSWIKSTSKSFYPIDYAWKKGTTPKRAKFNPDFFLKLDNAIYVIEIKDDEEIKDPSVENIKKYQYAQAHFEKLNKDLLTSALEKTVYFFHFLTPIDYPDFFQALRTGVLDSFRSKLDVKLASHT